MWVINIIIKNTCIAWYRNNRKLRQSWKHQYCKKKKKTFRLVSTAYQLLSVQNDGEMNFCTVKGKIDQLLSNHKQEWTSLWFWHLAHLFLQILSRSSFLHHFALAMATDMLSKPVCNIGAFNIILVFWKYYLCTKYKGGKEQLI